jgi:hypothetical protein
MQNKISCNGESKFTYVLVQRLACTPHAYWTLGIYEGDVCDIVHTSKSHGYLLGVLASHYPNAKRRE